MPQISSTNLPKSSPANLLSPPNSSSPEPNSRFKQALAKAAKPEQPNPGDPQPAKKPVKASKPVRNDPATSHAEVKKCSADDPDATTTDDSTNLDSQDAVDTQDTDANSSKSASTIQPTKSVEKEDNRGLQADGSIDLIADIAATPDPKATVEVPQDGTPLSTDTPIEKPAKTVGPASTTDTSDTQLSQIALSSTTQSASSSQVPDCQVSASDDSRSVAVGDEATSIPSAVKSPAAAFAKTDAAVQGPLPETSAADANASLDSLVETTDDGDTDSQAMDTPSTTSKPTRSPSSIAKKTSLTPGEMRPIPQGASLQSDDSALPNLTSPTLYPAASPSNSIEKAVESFDADTTTDKPLAKSDTDAFLDPSQLITTDKPAAHAATPSFASHLSATSSSADVASNNHDKIVQVVQSDLTPVGGTMKIRLDPPELGALQVTVKMSDGVMTASFETSTDQATKMLSHSLGQLKTALENSGVSVEKLHVQQAPKDSSSNGSGSGKDEARREQTRGSDDSSQQQRDQQRKEMIRRMWAKLGVGDPLDLVA